MNEINKLKKKSSKHRNEERTTTWEQEIDKERKTQRNK